ncbi:MAG: homoserine dehydrogenase [Armatimonadota bacterium]|nr:homoserine dehydrogenase [Armatimonadota bacterium]MDR5696415.1 homoserine dehydrogenase [Armatimonadota bacterium]
MLQIGLLGLGNVGTAVLRRLRAFAVELAHRAGTPLSVRRVAVAHPDRPRAVELERGLLTADAWEVVRDPHVDVVVELIGGIEPARGYVLEALRRGKSVVTANKQLMANRGRELLQAAESSGADLFFEGSVAGGVPIIRTIKESLAGDRIHEIAAILNGTTNYILTRMHEEGLSFGEALSEAQRMGFAESDPSDDVEGHDAAAKIAILATVAFNSRVVRSDVHCEGIGAISPREVAYARDLGYTIKLLAHAADRPEGMEAAVFPALVPSSHPLASVRHERNAVWMRAEAAGEIVISGRGAGGDPTASAVLSDLVAVARNRSHNAHGRVACTCYCDKPVRSASERLTSVCLVLRVADRPGVFAQVAAAFAEEGVSLHSIVQQNRGAEADVVLRTHPATERSLRAVLRRLGAMEVVAGISPLLRVLDGARPGP